MVVLAGAALAVVLDTAGLVTGLVVFAAGAFTAGLAVSLLVVDNPSTRAFF